jgi:hypothetical protein
MYYTRAANRHVVLVWKITICFGLVGGLVLVLNATFNNISSSERSDFNSKGEQVRNLILFKGGASERSDFTQRGSK